MGAIPPPDSYAQYPRAGTANPAILRKLADGYYGLNTAFGVNVVMAFIGRGIFTASSGVGGSGALLLVVGYILLLLGVVIALTLPHNKKIGEGLGWGDSTYIVVSILMGLNSALCCGVIGYVVVQMLAAKPLTAAGAPKTFFGFKKPELYAFIEQLERQSPGQPIP